MLIKLKSLLNEDVFSSISINLIKENINRSYSISNYPKNSGELEFFIKKSRFLII